MGILQEIYIFVPFVKKERRDFFLKLLSPELQFSQNGLDLEGVEYLPPPEFASVFKQDLALTLDWKLKNGGLSQMCFKWCIVMEML